MGGTTAPLTGPDFTKGIDPASVPDGGMLLGNAHGEAMLLVRHGDEISAVSATCTHYGGPLAEGLVVGGEIRCPWHHACFEARTGKASRPPALNPLRRWRVEHRQGRAFVGAEIPPAPPPRAAATQVESVVIVGAGAAGNAAAETLRSSGYGGAITMIGAEPTGPVDRPNLSKDYLAGTAPEEWIPLRDRGFYSAQGIELALGTAVLAIRPDARRVELADGSSRSYGALLLATGAEPIRLSIPGADAPHVHYLRSLADSRAIAARARESGRAVVIGASFIGLEVAAALRTRGVEVHVVAPDARPLERVLGPELGDFLRALHEEHGVTFHLRHTATAIERDEVVLDDGTRLAASLVVVGIGVRPSLGLAERAGLRLDRGVLVNEYLETSVPGIYAAGDIVRWPDPHSGRAVRIEHWVVAQRQGQTAARNILGAREPFRAVPFFWTQHYDVPVAYVGHAEGWDRVEVAGSVAGRSCVLAYRSGGRIAAVASIYRDAESLRAEALLERGDQAGLEALVASVT